MNSVVPLSETWYRGLVRMGCQFTLALAACNLIQLLTLPRVAA